MPSTELEQMEARLEELRDNILALQKKFLGLTAKSAELEAVLTEVKKGMK